MTEQVIVCTYNVMLSLSKPWRFNGSEERSERLGAVFCSTVNADVVCFQELTYNFDFVVESLVLDYPYSTSPMLASWCSANKIRFWPSGLCTVSRYPITHEHQYMFTGRTYHIERFVAKGALHTRVLHPRLGPFNVVNLHLNAWMNPVAQEVRNDQLLQVRQWYDSLDVVRGEPVVFCGDFNVDFYENFQQVEKFAAVVGAKCVVPEGVQFSFDAAANELVGLDDPREYLNVHNHEQEVPPRQLVDGFLVRGWDSASSRVVQLYSDVLFPMNFSLTSRRLARDLSDHFPVVLTVSGTIQTVHPLECGKCTQRVVVRDSEFCWRVWFYQVFATIVLLVGLRWLVRNRLVGSIT